MNTSIFSAKNLLVIGLAIVLGFAFQSCSKKDQPEIVTPPENGYGNILPGVFTVSSGEDGIVGTDDDGKVRFSRGNLYAKFEDGKWTWNFYREQYGYNSLNSKCDKVGNRIAKDNDTEIDLFTWGYSASTSLNPVGESYVTAHTNAYDELFYVFDWSVEENDDWGVPYCEANYDTAWHTLSISEWQYLFSNHSYKWVTVHGVAGFVIAPDNFVGTLADSYADDDALETDNLVFFPAAGWREVDKVYSVGDIGQYWSSSAWLKADYASCVYFMIGGNGRDVFLDGSCRRSVGNSVRLVISCQ